MFIKEIKAREILDSKGDPTIEAVLETNQGKFLASVPSGISKGKYEVRELRDKDGGVKKACENIEKIIGPVLKGEDPEEQDEIDSILIELDGTENKSRLGANAVLAVSMAVCRAGARAQKIPLWRHIAELSDNKKPKLPVPCFLLFEGGLHGEKLRAFSTQEFMVAMNRGSLAERIAKVRQIYSFLKKKTKAIVGKPRRNPDNSRWEYSGQEAEPPKRLWPVNSQSAKDGFLRGKEGAFAPILKNSQAALEIIKKALKAVNVKEKLVLDMAASHFAKAGKYDFEGSQLSNNQLLEFYKKLIAQYSILAIEDPFSQDDWLGFRKMTKELGKKILIIGDDLLVTNLELTKKAVKQKACNAMVIKPNQVGTVTETIGVANFARSQGLKLFAKHRGGETKDSFLADLAVGIGTDYIAAGGLLQEERMAKYQRLLEIEKEL